MATPWRELAGSLDSASLEQWGESVRILPWVRGEGGGPDFSRGVIDQRIAVFSFAADQIVSAGGRTAGFASRFAQADITMALSVVGLPYIPREGDHVYAIDRNAYFEISLPGKTVSNWMMFTLTDIPQGND
jgi:hypothetical protein